MAAIDIVTQDEFDEFREELDKRLQGYDNTFDKLKALEDGHRALTERLDNLAELIKSQPWSPEMETVLEQLAADRQASEIRFARLTGRGSSTAPSPAEIDGLVTLLDERLKLTESMTTLTARLTQAEADHRWLRTWIGNTFGLNEDWTISSVLDDIFARNSATETRVTRLAERVNDHELRLQALERQGKFSLSTFLITLVGIAALGWVVGWAFFDAWVAGGFIGLIAGAIIGLVLGSRKGRRSSRPIPPTPPAGSTGSSSTPRS